MALQHRVSDAVNMRIDTEQSTNTPVIEIEFKFIRYRLVVDDTEKAEKLYELLTMVLSKGGEAPKRDLPAFYKKK